MALPGKQGSELQSLPKRLKLCLIGEAKVGKTTAATQFPDAFFIDTEAGAQHDQYIDLMTNSNARYFETASYSDLMSVVRQLIEEEHDRKTLIIDPLTTIYASLVDEGERIVGTDFNKHVNYASTRMRRLYGLLLRLDMNLIVIEHAKEEYKMVNGKFEGTGELVPDGFKKTAYYFDLVVTLRKRGKLREARVTGTRLKEFGEHDSFEWSYGEFVRRLGIEGLEREAVAVELASSDQVASIAGLIQASGISPEKEASWLKKAKASEWSEVTAEIAIETIQYLKNKSA